MGMQWLNISSLVFQGIASVIIFAVLEEMAKLSSGIFVVMRHRLDFNQVIDGVVYAVTAALGFAFVENAIYLTEFFGRFEKTARENNIGLWKQGEG